MSHKVNPMWPKALTSQIPLCGPVPTSFVSLPWKVTTMLTFIIITSLFLCGFITKASYLNTLCLRLCPYASMPSSLFFHFISFEFNLQAPLCSFCYWPGFLVSLINRNWSEGGQEIQASPYWCACCSRKGIKTRKRLPGSLASPGSRGGAWYGVRMGVGSGVRLERGLRECVHCFSAAFRGPAWCPAFVPMAAGCFRLFVSCRPNYAHMRHFPSPL